MSKASEWAKRLQELAGDAPQFQSQDFVPIAGVVVSPKSIRCQLNQIDLLPEDAILLAHWILDTFGEPAQSPHNPSPERG